MPDSHGVIPDLYRESNVPADQLPYTDAFDAMYLEYERRTGERVTKNEFWRRICQSRKSGDLPRLRR